MAGGVNLDMLCLLQVSDTPLGHDTFNMLARQLSAGTCRLTKLQLKDVLAGGGVYMDCIAGCRAELQPHDCMLIGLFGGGPPVTNAGCADGDQGLVTLKPFVCTAHTPDRDGDMYHGCASACSHYPLHAV